MRIALVSDCYPPRLGGIEVQVADLAAQLRTAGHHAVVITATPGPSTPFVLRLPGPVSLGAPVGLGAGRALAKVLARADVVHAHLGVLGPFAQRAAGIAAGQGVPTVLTWHSLPGSSPLAMALAPGWRRLLEQGVNPTAVSSVAAEQLATLLRSASVPVLRNGLDLAGWSVDPGGSHLRPADGKRTEDPGVLPPRVVSAMRFAVRKRPLRLVALMSRVRDLVPASRRPRLSILGDGPWWAPLDVLVRSTPLREWVELPGRIPRERMADHLRSSDLYVAASRREAFGIAALEARCAGLPVAGYAGSGVADLVDAGLGGVLAGSDREMANALAGLLTDPSRLARYAAYHRSHPPLAHDWPVVTAATLRQYERAYRGGGPSRADIGSVAVGADGASEGSRPREVARGAEATDARTGSSPR
ncbi:MAG: glycosyltransferase family 4 protein [Ornithinimicrobium sp.]